MNIHEGNSYKNIISLCVSLRVYVSVYLPLGAMDLYVISNCSTPLSLILLFQEFSNIYTSLQMIDLRCDINV